MIWILVIGNCIEMVPIFLDSDILIELLLSYQCDLIQMKRWNKHNFTVTFEICNSFNFFSKINSRLNSNLSKLKPHCQIQVLLSIPVVGLDVKDPCEIEEAHSRLMSIFVIYQIDIFHA